MRLAATMLHREKTELSIVAERPAARCPFGTSFVCFCDNNKALDITINSQCHLTWNLQCL